MKDSVPGPWDHDLSQRQMLNHWATQVPLEYGLKKKKWKRKFEKKTGEQPEQEHIVGKDHLAMGFWAQCKEVRQINKGGGENIRYSR